ncbi:putative reverse transcriptase domain-containing protein [Tanacetum coccineum]
MLRVFPISLTGAAARWLRNEPTEPDETLYQEWERFKELLMKCPQHYLTEMREVILFYNWLDVPTRQIIDSRGRSTETSDGLVAIQAQLNNLGREIKKVNEKVYAAQVGCEQCKGPHYTKDCPQKEEGKTLEEAYYTQFGVPFQGGGYRETTPGYYQRNNANPSFHERRQSMEDT